MTTSDAPSPVEPVDAFFASFSGARLEVEVERGGAIAAVWADAVALRPRMYDGRILLAGSAEVSDGRFHARFDEARFSTLVWLKTVAAETVPVRNVFGAAAVVSSDGAVLLGRMAPHTSNAGQLYFPCGTPDLSDVVGESVDLEASILRELQEETGLAPPLIRPSEIRFVVRMGVSVACIRRFDTDLEAAEIEALFARHIAADPNPELDAVALVRSAAELTEASPAFVHAAVSHLL